MLEMKIFILTVTVAFLSVLDSSRAEPCTTPVATECLAKPKRPNDQQIELNVLYADSGPPEPLGDLFKFICSAQSKLPNTVKIRMMVGATVTKGDNGIECVGGDCTGERREGCILSYESVATACDFECPTNEFVDDCLKNKQSDESLAKTGALACSLGIDPAKLPALVVDQKYYDPCATFTSEQDMLTFVCGFYEQLEGC